VRAGAATCMKRNAMSRWDASSAGAAAASCQVINVADVNQDARYIASETAIRSEVAVPLILHDRVIGVVDLESVRFAFFTEEHVRTLKLLAPQIANSVENARLYEELAQREQRMQQDLKAAYKLQSVLLPRTISGLIGAIWQLRDNLALDVGLRYAARVDPNVARFHCVRRDRRDVLLSHADFAECFRDADIAAEGAYCLNACLRRWIPHHLRVAIRQRPANLCHARPGADGVVFHHIGEEDRIGDAVRRADVRCDRVRDRVNDAEAILAESHPGHRCRHRHRGHRFPIAICDRGPQIPPDQSDCVKINGVSARLYILIRVRLNRVRERQKIISVEEVDQDVLGVVREQLGQFTDALNENRDLAVFFFSPYFSTAEKKGGLHRLLSDPEEILLNFLETLTERHRMPVIFRIRQRYDQMWDEAHRMLPVEVTSAIELDKQTVRSIGERIGEQTGREVELSSTVDPEILGGLVLRVGNFILDASIRNRLNQLRKQVA